MLGSSEALLKELDGINNDGKARRKLNLMGKDRFRYDDFFYSLIKQILHNPYVLGVMFLPFLHTEQPEA